VPNNSALVLTVDVNPEEIYELSSPAPPANFLVTGRACREENPLLSFRWVSHPPLTRVKEQSSRNHPEMLIFEDRLAWTPSIGKDHRAILCRRRVFIHLSQPNSRFHRALVDTGRRLGPLTSVADALNVGSCDPRH